MHLCALEGRLGLGLFARSGVRFVLTLWCGLIPLPAVFNCVRAMKQFGWQGHGLDPEQHQAHTNWSNYGKMGRDSGCSVASVEGPIWSGVTNRFDHRKGRRRIVSPCSRQWMNERCTHTYLIIFIYYARWCTYIYIYIYLYVSVIADWRPMAEELYGSYAARIIRLRFIMNWVGDTQRGFIHLWSQHQIRMWRSAPSQD